MTLDNIINNKTIQGECWIWSGGVQTNGRGIVYYNGQYWQVHRLIYKIFNFDFNSSLFVLHKCDVGLCFNPLHLFQGTNKDNILDMCNKGRHWRQQTTHCPKGHEYTPENTYINSKAGTRSCKICRTARNRRIA